MIQTPVYFQFHRVITIKRTLVENKLRLNNNRYEMDFADLEESLKKALR